MVSAAAKSVGQVVAKLLIEEAKFLYGVESKVEELHQELAWMQGFLQELDKRQQREEMIRMWVTQVRDLAYEAEDIVEKYIHKVSARQARRSMFPAIVKRVSTIAFHARSIHEVGGEIVSITKKMSQLNARLVSYGVKVTTSVEGDMQYRSRIRELRQAVSDSVEKDLIKRVGETEKMVNKLILEGGTKVAGIVGMGGLGKTLLAKEVYNDATLRGEFKNLAWVYVSQHPNKRLVLEEIYRALDGEAVDLASLGDKEVCEKVNQILIEKKCLIVLDDIWHKETWLLLKGAFGSILNESSTSKLLLTSRNGQVVKDIVNSDDSILTPKPLSDKESWILLRSKALPGIQEETEKVVDLGISGGESGSLIDDKIQNPNPNPEFLEKKKIGERMLKHCGGLPIAIVSLGGILATRSTVEEWLAVEKHIGVYLTKAATGGKDDDIAEIGAAQVLEMSYSDLPFYLKPCFLSLGNFDESQEIPTDTLYQLWQAEGFVREPEESELDDNLGFCEIAEQNLNELVKRCMVEVGRVSNNGKIETCRMHGFMRALCINKCKEESFFQECTMRSRGGNEEEEEEEEEEESRSSAKTQAQTCHRIVVPVEEEQPSDKLLNWMEDNAPRPRSMIMRNTREASPISKVWFSKMGKALRLLRILRLEQGSVREVPGVLGSYVHLRYLRLGLPEKRQVSSVIWKLNYLQTLDLRDSERGVVIPNKLWMLKKLIHLYLPDLGYEIVNEDDKLKLSQPTEMETLVNCILETFHEDDLRKMKNLRVVSLKSKDVVDAKTLELVLRHMITPRLLTNPLSELKIDARGFKKNGKILISNPNANIENLTIRGEVIDKKMDEIFFPRTLRLLCLCQTKIPGDWIAQLNIPSLKVLKLLDNAIKGDKIVFSTQSFEELTELELEWPDNASTELIVEGNLPECCHLTIWCSKNSEEQVSIAIRSLDASVTRRPDIFVQG